MANHFPNEPVFVPRSLTAEEDDGVVLSVVWDGDKRASYLVIIDGMSATVPISLTKLTTLASLQVKVWRLWPLCTARASGLIS